jgi:hypothetical protein
MAKYIIIKNTFLAVGILKPKRTYPMHPRPKQSKEKFDTDEYSAYYQLPHILVILSVFLTRKIDFFMKSVSNPFGGHTHQSRARMISTLT